MIFGAFAVPAPGGAWDNVSVGVPQLSRALSRFFGRNAWANVSRSRSFGMAVAPPFNGWLS